MEWGETFLGAAPGGAEKLSQQGNAHIERDQQDIFEQA
jgi:hypothetical protein